MESGGGGLFWWLSMVAGQEVQCGGEGIITRCQSAVIVGGGGASQSAISPTEAGGRALVGAGSAAVRHVSRGGSC